MSELIDELRSEHAKISDCLLQAKEEGINSIEGKNHIFSAKQLLLSHLDKEDRLLYPVLQESAEQNHNMKKILSDYALDMQKISINVLFFFEFYENEANSTDHFQSDCDGIIRALTKRISKEEAVLYEQYNQLKPS